MVHMAEEKYEYLSGAYDTSHDSKWKNTFPTETSVTSQVSIGGHSYE